MTTLGAWLKGQGFTVDDNDVPYGRESVWHGVDFIVWHHTVTDCTGSEQSLANLCRKGFKGTFPPLCHIVAGNSGKIWMTCRERAGQNDPGRASHAGSGSGFGVATDAMNQHSLGIEFQCSGKHPISTHTHQYNVGIELTAALCRRYNVPPKNVIAHREWSSTGKVDVRDSMSKVRADVARALEGSGNVSDNYDYAYLGKPTGTFTVTRDYKTLDQSTWEPPRSGWEHTYCYLNIKPTFSSGKTAGAIRCRIMREDGDTTGHLDIVIHKEALDSEGKMLYHWLYWEAGEKAIGTKVQLVAIGGLASAAVGTRYVKKAVVVD